MEYVAYYRISQIKDKYYKQKNEGESKQQFKKRFIEDEFKMQKMVCRNATSIRGHKVVKEFTEVESSRKSRPVLKAAVYECIASGLNLVVSNTDRLHRDMFSSMFLKKSMEQHGLKVMFADNPEMGFIEFALKSAMAHEEWEKTSQKQKDAYKASEKTYGNPNLKKPEYKAKLSGYLEKARSVVSDGALKNPENKKSFAFIEMCWKNGVRNKSEIARMMNEAGYTTSKGTSLCSTKVNRIARLYGLVL